MCFHFSKRQINYHWVDYKKREKTMIKISQQWERWNYSWKCRNTDQMGIFLNANKWNPGEMASFLDSYHLPSLTQDGADGLNKSITSVEIETMKTLSKNKCIGPDGFTNQFYMIFYRDTHSPQTLSKTEMGGGGETLPNTVEEASSDPQSRKWCYCKTIDLNHWWILIQRSSRKSWQIKPTTY